MRYEGGHGLDSQRPAPFKQRLMEVRVSDSWIDNEPQSTALCGEDPAIGGEGLGNQVVDDHPIS